MHSNYGNGAALTRSKRLRALALVFGLAFPCFAALSTLWSLDPRATLGSSLVLALVTGTLILARQLPTVLLHRAIWGMFLLLMLVNALVTAYSLFTLTPYGPGRWFSPLFDHPGRAGMASALFTLVAIAAYLKRPGRIMALLTSVLAFLNACLVSVSGTRLGLLAIVSGLAMLFVIRGNRLLLKFTFVLVVAAGIVMGSTLLPFSLSASEEVRPGSQAEEVLEKMPASFSGTLLLRLSGEPWNDFSSGRIATWKSKLDDVRHDPLLGVGFDASQARPEMMAHSQVITVAEELGLVGLGLFIMWLLLILGPCWRVFNQNPMSLVLVGSAAIMSGDSFLFGWRNPVSMLTWSSVLLAVLIALELNRERDSHQ